MWDAEKEGLVSWYFTTAGFYTQAAIHFEDGNLISVEDVTGNENGITQVKAIVEFLPNGDLVIGGFGFREGNSGGPISLLRLDPSNTNASGFTIE